ncbi:hypothetical protein [Azotobacter vinelandii]
MYRLTGCPLRLGKIKLKEYRSPNCVFAEGDKVVIHGNRPRPYGWTPETAEAFAYNGR